MSDPPSNAGERSVRVEFFAGDAPVLDDTAPVAVRETSRVPFAVMALVLAGLFGGLWWAAGFANDPDPSADNVVPEPDEAALQPPGTMQPEAGFDEPPSFETDSQRVWAQDQNFQDLAIDLRYLVEAPRGLVSAQTELDGLTPRVVITRTSDGRTWASGSPRSVPAGARVVGLVEQPDAPDDEQVLLWVASPNETGGSSGDLVVYESSGGVEGDWVERSRFDVDGHVRTVSVRGPRWVAIVDERAQATSSVPPMRTRVATGLIAGGDVEQLSVAPDEFITSFAAIDDGFVATVIRLQLASQGDQEPALQLRTWRSGQGWEAVAADLSVDGETPARLIDGGRNGVFLTAGSELMTIDPSSREFRSTQAVSGRAVMNEIVPGLLPELTPARAGNGYLIVDNVVGDSTRVWVSLDGTVWRRVDLLHPLRDVSLVRIDAGTALLSAASEGETGVLRVDTTGPLPLDVRARELADGEWATPVFSAARIGDAGFVGLTSSNGRIDLIESLDGFVIDNATVTDFPFGYFANDMETTTAGYHVVGQLGLIEDAVFTSDDGISWDRFPIDRPSSATALQIDHFHRGDRTAAMTGSLGWADDLSRTERVVLWWDDEGTQNIVPARPCGEGFDACTISSLLAVDDGILVTHSSSGTTAVSRWNQSDGWVLASDAAQDVLDGALFAPSSAGTGWLLGATRVLGSQDSGRTWTEQIEPPPGQQGRFLGVSSSGTAAVFESVDTLWFLSSQKWTAFDLDTVVVGKLLAITEDAAVLSGIATQDPERSSVVIRLVAPTAR